MAEDKTPNPRFLQGSQNSVAAREYDSDYYDRLRPCAYSRENPVWLQFAGRIADELVTQLNPHRVLDVGCAKGFLVECLRDRGVEAYGFDVSEYAIGEVRGDLKPYCWVGSAADPIKEEYDLITCIEVCEHMSEAEANEAIRQMTSHSSAILFSSTPCDFTEPTHVNVRPIIDWLRLFAEFSFTSDEKFDCSFIAPQAMLFRQAQVRPPDQVLCRFAHLKNRAIIAVELRELDMILNSKGWKLLNLYRDLRARVKQPISQALRKLRLI